MERAEQNTEVTDLIATIDALNGKLETHAELVRESDKRSRWARILAFIGIAVAAIGIIVGVLGVLESRDAKNLLNESEKERQARSYGSCVQHNVTVDSRRRVAIEPFLRVIPPEDQRTPEQVENLRIYTEEVYRLLPYRVCTDEGIEEYLENPPDDPALTDPNG